MRHLQFRLYGADKRVLEIYQLLDEIGFSGDHHFGARGRRRRASIGDEISDGKIDLMANRGNNRNRRSKDRPRYDLLIEGPQRSEEHTSELQSHHDLVCRLLLEKKKKN